MYDRIISQTGDIYVQSTSLTPPNQENERHLYVFVGTELIYVSMIFSVRFWNGLHIVEFFFIVLFWMMNQLIFRTLRHSWPIFIFIHVLCILSFQDGPLPSNAKVKDNTLTLSNFMPHNIGNYECIASNSEGSGYYGLLLKA